jgi:hypothetical protein
MFKKTKMMLALGCLAVLMAACGTTDPAAKYYPTYTAIAQGLIDLVNTATAQAAVPAETPVPPAPAGGTENVQQPDGTTKYSDYDAGFEMTLPAGWLGLRPGAQEFNDALGNEGATNEDLKYRMELDQQGYEQVYDRYYFYATKPEEVENALLAYGKLAWNPSDSKLMDPNTLGELIQNLEMSKDLPGLRVVASNLITNGNNVPVIVLGANWTQQLSDGTTIPLYLNFMFFKPTENSTARIVLTSQKEFRDVIGPDVDAMVQSIKLVGP